MAKLTNAQLNALVAKLEKENEDLKGYIKGCSDMIEGDGTLAVKIERFIKTEPKTETKTSSNIITVPEEKKVEVMRWLMRIVGYEPQNVPDAFFVEFDILTNADRNWWAFTPKSGGLSNLKSAFVKGFNKARFEKQVPGNYYKNTGAWINVNVKK